MDLVNTEAEQIAYWDAYRSAYSTMTYEQVAAAHRIIWQTYPDQSHHSAFWMDHFFEHAADRSSILEVGGWRGEAAARTLANHEDIEYWDNYEISIDAVANPATDDPRYQGIWPPTWIWEMDLPRQHTIAVLAHVIEHVSDDQLEPFISFLDEHGIQEMYIEAPLWDGPRGWWGGNTAHLLMSGWSEVTRLLHEHGFVVHERLVGELDHVILFVSR